MSYRRSKERNHRLKKLYELTKNEYGAGAYYDVRKGRYIRYAAGGQNSRKYLRRVSSKKMRRTPEVLNHSLYKRSFDYYWELF